MNRNSLPDLTWLQETRAAAKDIADELRQEMVTFPADSLSPHQRHAREEANMLRVADAFNSFKAATITAGAISIGIHPVYHTKLEVWELVQFHRECAEGLLLSS